MRCWASGGHHAALMDGAVEHSSESWALPVSQSSETPGKNRAGSPSAGQILAPKVGRIRAGLGRIRTEDDRTSPSLPGSDRNMSLVDARLHLSRAPDEAAKFWAHPGRSWPKRSTTSKCTPANGWSKLGRGWAVFGPSSVVHPNLVEFRLELAEVATFGESRITSAEILQIWGRLRPKLDHDRPIVAVSRLNSDELWPTSTEVVPTPSLADVGPSSIKFLARYRPKLGEAPIGLFRPNSALHGRRATKGAPISTEIGTSVTKRGAPNATE